MLKHGDVYANEMTISQIRKLQKKHGLEKVQASITSGDVWDYGSPFEISRAINTLKSGACMLPKYMHKDKDNVIIPARQQLNRGEAGSFQNSDKYWSQQLTQKEYAY